MLGYIREAKTPKEAWENLRKIFAANTTARRLQLRQELNNIQQRDMSIMAYTLKIKELCDSFGSISVNIDDDEMVQICLSGLAPRFGAMRIAVLAREKSTPSSRSNQRYWSKNTTCVQGAMSRKATCSTRTRMEEEDVDEQEADSAKDKADEVQPTTTTPSFGRKTEANKEPSQEGGVSLQPESSKRN